MLTPALDLAALRYRAARFAARISDGADLLAAWLEPSPELGRGVPHPSPDTPVARLTRGHALDRVLLDDDLGEHRPFGWVQDRQGGPQRLHDAVLEQWADAGDPSPVPWQAHRKRVGSVVEEHRLALANVADWPEVADVDPPWRPGELGREWLEKGMEQYGGNRWRRARRPGAELLPRELHLDAGDECS